MPAKVGYSTPMLHVAEIEKSIQFYELLGFTTVDTDRCEPLGWARLHCEGGAVMFLRAEGLVDASAHPVMLCMYTPDLAGLREHLLASGLQAPPIRHPQYMPSGEITMADPDGNIIVVSHWGKSEQEAWEKRISAKTDNVSSLAPQGGQGTGLWPLTRQKPVQTFFLQKSRHFDI